MFVKNINLVNGLSQCVVTDVVVDKQGFLWIGTFDGLNRFDGANFKIFKHVVNDEHSLISSKVLKLFADDNSHIWVRTAAGMSILDTRTGKIVQPELVKNYSISWVCKNDEESVWAYVKSVGLLLINTSNFTTKLYANQQDSFSETCEVMDMYCLNNKVFVVSNCGDIISYIITTGQFKLIKKSPVSEVQYDNSGVDKFGNIYLGSQQTDMACFNPGKSEYYNSGYYKQNINLISVRSIYYDTKNDILLLGTYGQGLFIYDYSDSTLKQYKKAADGLHLCSNYLTRCIADNNGVIYTGSDGSGLDMFHPFIKKFTTLTKNDPDDLKSLRFVRRILEDDHDNLLMGTSGSGLVKYNRKTREFAFYNANNLLPQSHNFIIELIRVGDELWLGNNGSGIDILELNTLKKKATILPGTGDNSLSDGVIWSFLNDGKGNIWVGTRGNGLNKVNAVTRKVTQFSKVDYPLLAGGLRCMSLLKNKNILLGSEEGLFEISTESGSIKSVLAPDLSKSFHSFKSIYIDKQDRIWLGTDGAGIAVLNKNYQLLTNFNTTNYLNNDVVYGILPQNDSVLWISSNAGISSIHWNESSLTKNGKILIYNYDEKNGLQSNEFNTGAYTILKDGSMVFGGLNGVNIFKPDEIKNNPEVPVVYITDFKVFENPLQNDTLISALSSVHLKNFENSLSITFSTIGFSLPDKVKYKYRLLGYNDSWINAENRNYVSFTNLHSGDYEFQVKACNNDGVWNEQYTSLAISIATPFYKKWWSLALALIAMFQLAYLFYRSRVKLAKKQEAIRMKHTKEMAEVEMKALRAQINPHFLFNSLNSINSYILKNDNKLASKYLVKFSQLVRNILNNSSSPFVTLSEELNTIELYMQIEGMRFNNQFSYLIDIEPGINPANILIPSLLLQPYVENAIWHGLLHKVGEKNITIKVSSQSEESVCIVIDDNGVGREMAARIEQKPDQQKSFGMELGANRLKLMNNNSGNISTVDVIDKIDEHQQASGTTIRIIISGNQFIKEKISLN